MKFNAIILGTDHNSYSVARSFYEAYDKKPIVVGSAVLVPFYNSKIADVYTQRGFSSDNKIFRDFLNEVISKREEDSFIIFAPTESYVDILLKNKDGFNFDAKIPYPPLEMAEELLMKSKFYKKLEKIGVRYPKTQVINGNNIDELNLPGKLFLKADDYDNFIALDIDNKQKGYWADDSYDAKEILKKIYKSTYDGDMIVQQFIEGGQGSEYSLNGYRSSDGKISMVLARNLLSDLRPMRVGNHLVQIDHNDDIMYDTAQKIVNSLDYHGLFNIDFKKDSNTDEVFVLEMNIRQGRTFYYSTLGGVNLIKAATDDLILRESHEERTKKAFRLQAISTEVARANVERNLLNEFDDPKREENSAIHIVSSYDNGILRKIKVNESIKNQEKELFD